MINALLAYVADVVLSEQYCAFNVMRIKGNHRQCDHYARVEIGSHGFCKAHAKIVRAALVDAKGPKD
jgi:hypothetical protein